MESTMKRQPKTGPAKKPSPDSLVTKDEQKTEVELKEDELKQVSGGLIALLHKAT
jgi:bacteriocin-like protein